MTAQLDLFDGAFAPVGPAKPRPVAADSGYTPEYVQVVAEVFSDTSNIYRYMGWISIPSDDHRPKAAGHRTPRRSRVSPYPVA